MYHNSGDLVRSFRAIRASTERKVYPQSEREGYDYEQIRSITKVVLATILEVGGFAFV
jgi:hypothetical protein